MPVHDWTRVEAGIFHAFHHGWIEELKRSLNTGILPAEYYAMVEQHQIGSGQASLTLQTQSDEDADEAPAPPASHGGVSLLLSPPAVRLTVETDMEFYRRKQDAVVVRHATGDRIVDDAKNGRMRSLFVVSPPFAFAGFR